MANRREDALRYAMTLLHQRYRWGGYSPETGFDCSGFLVEDLKMVDVLPRGRKMDWTAAGLFHLFHQERGRPVTTAHGKVQPGFLLFWRTSAGQIRHIEMCIAKYGDVVMTIGASGGGSKTVSNAVALAQDARIKIRRAYDGWEALDPF